MATSASGTKGGVKGSYGNRYLSYKRLIPEAPRFRLLTLQTGIRVIRELRDMSATIRSVHLEETVGKRAAQILAEISRWVLQLALVVQLETYLDILWEDNLR